MLVVNPNLCFDRTLTVEEFAVGTVSRPSSVVVSAGGKGVNVARTARDLGEPALLVGLLADREGQRLSELLRAEGLDFSPVPVAGEVRSATIVLETSGRATVLNEAGPELDETDLDRLLTHVASRLETVGGPLVCSGSLPPGLPVETVARLTAVGRAAQVPVVIDAARAALEAALPAGPDLVTPNLAEAEGLVSGVVVEDVETDRQAKDEIVERAAKAALGLVERGARRAVVTAGGHGVSAAVDGSTTWIDAPVVTVANPIGAGDSFTSGVAVALARGAEWIDAVRHGVLVASAAVERHGAGRVDPVRVADLGGHR